MEKYKKHAISKRRQHSSYKESHKEKINMIDINDTTPLSRLNDAYWEPEERERNSDREMHQVKSREDHFLNRKISEDLRRKQDLLNKKE